MSGVLTEVEEAEANYFAMCLLMPEDIVRREVRRLGGIDLADDKHFIILARKFQVNVGMMGIRIGQLMGRSAKL